jgi:hypothetical protein
MEAETNAGCETAQRIIWARNLCSEMGFRQSKPTTLFEDNSSCITASSSWKQHPGTRHYELKQHFLRDRVIEKKDIIMYQIKTTNMIADLLTKNLSYPIFARHRNSMGIIKPVKVSGQGSVGTSIETMINIHRYKLV